MHTKKEMKYKPFIVVDCSCCFFVCIVSLFFIIISTPSIVLDDAETKSIALMFRLVIVVDGT